MILFQYLCKKCNFEFEEFNSNINPKEINCPKCNSKNCEKKLGSVNIKMGYPLNHPSKFINKNKLAPTPITRTPIYKDGKTGKHLGLGKTEVFKRK
jgi:putative FmdB family regulatory protein